ncbi:McrC family protein [Psychromonas sp. Urea-02u-13]|uniref:McrC family protein n=1 Tax=Psychromonas sp. Urea-02u-13 TaxID=2058326 RepID=UPI001E61C487|nr:McrC family protein [Psychromonas sp. Urea-02u-13]
MTKMNNTISLFEFEYLVNEKQGTQNAAENIKVVSDVAFHYLKQLSLQMDEESRLLKPCRFNGLEVLQVQNYAGVIFTPDNTQIEVLPKVGKQGGDSNKNKQEARSALLMMLKSLKGFRHIETQAASIASQKMPLLEVFITQFLETVNTLIKRGLRSDYVAREDNLAYLKGKLNIGKQVRHNFINKHKFYVEYDEFLQDRPANRLLHSALVCINKYTRSANNQKLLQELKFVFTDVPVSKDYKLDFTRMKLDRGMDYYKRPLNWAQLILEGFSPQSMKGKNHAPSLLFPMEAVFESYVANILRKQVANGYQLKEQVQSKSLVKHAEQHWFRLKPDLIIEKDNETKVVLDTKWKLLEQSKDNGTAKYGLSQSDFYQMFAYGHKYLSGKGDMFLLYPQSEDFTQAIQSSFCFNPEAEEKLNLWIVPVDLSVGVKDEERIQWPDESPSLHLAYNKKCKAL